MSLNDVEEEVILLKAVWDLVGSMVSSEILKIFERDPDSSIQFHTRTHQKFFNIVLVDFLSATDKRAFIKKTSYLGALKNISASPKFDVNNSVASLSKATHEFVDWLNQEVEVHKVWLPSISTETSLKLTRISSLKMCGNISKHNFLRLIGVADELKEILSNNGVSIGLDEAVLALDDFYGWFHDDILNYQASTIAEFLNNIRWGIYEYLQPEYQRSLVLESREPLKYHYTYPAGLTSALAQSYYWDLMNEVREPPHVRRFQVTKMLKLRY
jgi:hypothetical protein